MLEILKIFIGIIFLIIGYFVGEWLANVTKDEQKEGERWFKAIILISLISAIISLVFKNDVLLFTFLFIAVVTSRSLRRK